MSNAEPPLRRNSHANLERILKEMIERPDAEPELAREIDEQFGETRAVLVLDMSGFSRTTRKHGIIAFLLMIQQMRLIGAPAVHAHGGIVVKAEADNLYCLLESVEAAIRAAGDIMGRLAEANAALPEERRLYASIGIGWGRILNIDERDMFGDEVNLACKLGEDIAERGEILLTEAAHARLPQSGAETRSMTASISGLAFGYHRLVQP